MFKAFALTVLCFSFVFAVIYTAGVLNMEVIAVFLGSFIAVFLILYRSFHKFNKREKELKALLDVYMRREEELKQEKYKIESKMNIFREFYNDIKNAFRPFEGKEVYIYVKKNNKYVPVSKKDKFGGVSNLAEWIRKRIDVIEKITAQSD